MEFHVFFNFNQNCAKIKTQNLICKVNKNCSTKDKNYFLKNH